MIDKNERIKDCTQKPRPPRRQRGAERGGTEGKEIKGSPVPAISYGGDNQRVMDIAAKHVKELSVLHHCLEVSNLYDACLVVLCEVGQVGIATDDVFGANGIGQREKIEVFRVADG